MADATWDIKRSFKLLSRMVQEMVHSRPAVLDPGRNNGSGMGSPNTKTYQGLLYTSGGLVADDLYPWDETPFSDTATAWEKRWSKLCDPANQFTPILIETPLLRQINAATVGAHYGWVRGEQLCQTRGQIVRDAKTGTLTGDGFVFVQYNGTDATPPKGYHQWGDPQMRYEVITTVDGQVLQILSGYSVDYVEVDSTTPLDLLFAYVMLVEMIGAVGTRLITVLATKTIVGRASRKVLAGCTSKLAQKVEEEVPNFFPHVRLDEALASRNLKFGTYTRKMGIPRAHLESMLQAAKEADVIAIMRANKESAIELIERGAVGKPKALSVPGFKSRPDTGVLTAETADQVALCKRNNYFLVEKDGVARRTIGGKAEEIKLNNAYWKVEEGQVIDPSGHPVVGDYDGLGAIPMESPGRQMAAVPNDPYGGDWLGPDFKRFMDAVNPRLDKMRVLHGAQEAYPDLKNAGKYGGLTDDIAYAVFPDGRVMILNGKAEQTLFYEAFGRQTIIGSYNK